MKLLLLKLKESSPVPSFYVILTLCYSIFLLGEIWAWYDALIILPIQDNDNKDESAKNAASTKKADSDF